MQHRGVVDNPIHSKVKLEVVSVLDCHFDYVDNLMPCYMK